VLFRSSFASAETPAEIEQSRDWAMIGHLLIAAGLISQENLAGASSIANKLCTPLDRVLSSHGYMGQKLLDTAIEVQILIRKHELTFEAGVRALKVTGQGEASLNEVLSKPELVLSIHQPLGELLAMIGAATTKQLRTAVSDSLETGLPVGWVLLSYGIVTEALLTSAISAQRMIQEGALPYDQILNCLRTARLKQKDFRKILSEQSVDTKAIDRELLITHLLVNSGVVLKSELLVCREFALLESTTVDQVLTDFGILEDTALKSVLAIMTKVSKGELTVKQGVAILQKLKRVNWDMAKIDSHPVSKEKIELTDLIGLTGLLSETQLKTAVEQSNKAREPLSKTLVDGEFLEELAVDAIEKCKVFVNSNLLHLHKALALVCYCADNRCTLEEAFAQFGWSPVIS